MGSFAAIAALFGGLVALVVVVMVAESWPRLFQRVESQRRQPSGSTEAEAVVAPAAPPRPAPGPATGTGTGESNPSVATSGSNAPTAARSLGAAVRPRRSDQRSTSDRGVAGRGRADRRPSEIRDRGAGRTGRRGRGETGSRPAPRHAGSARTGGETTGRPTEALPART